MDAVVELLSKLVSIPSVNPMGQEVSGPEYLETRLTAYLEDWLKSLDVEVRRQPVSTGRDNVLATYHAPGARCHLLLEVHQDTVPVQGMVIDPFGAHVESGRLYGRGACDNKGPMTAMLLALRRLAAERPPGSANVTLALSVDEEHTFRGAAEMVRQGLAMDAAIVAEPTSLDVVISHKGVVRWETWTHGRACHSSTPARGINAIYRMGRVLAALERHAAELADRPGDPLLGPPSLSVGRIGGGLSVNTVPDSCRIEVDRRLVPGETPLPARAEAMEYIQSHPWIDFEVEFRDPWLAVPPMAAGNNGPLQERLGASIRRFRPAYQVKGVAFGTDGAPISAAGIPTVVFGPGSIDKAHTEDEWVPLDEVAQAAEIYFDFCARAGSWSASPRPS